ncbi:MAG: ATP-binding cassette domain-containing protein [Lachnospiraceae bacterium]|nr:ATP-binding cassette domain-containing protein [Lachnospiraceae bacterium]
MELETRSVTKTYDKGRVRALSDLSVKFTPGIYGLLGPNGAGKSTLINILTTNMRPDKGQVIWDGREIIKAGKSYRTALGFMPQQQNLYDDFSGDEFLWYMASLKGIPKKTAAQRIDQMIDAVNLREARYKRLREYSGGMKQRILIAQAMLNDPDILIMDEPTAGLDPNERIRITNYISQMAEGKIVIFATHVISDIEFIADRIILINHGRLIRNSSPFELQESIRGKVYEGLIPRNELEELRADQTLISNMHYAGNDVRTRIITDRTDLSDAWRPADPELSDVYLYYNFAVEKNPDSDMMERV